MFCQKTARRLDTLNKSCRAGVVYPRFFSVLICRAKRPSFFPELVDIHSETNLRPIPTVSELRLVERSTASEELVKRTLGEDRRRFAEMGLETSLRDFSSNCQFTSAGEFSDVGGREKTGRES